MIASFFWAGALFAAGSTVCLNMVVKNDSEVIGKCLNSVKDRIDSWAIADLGSTDGTEEIVRECLKGIPGEFIQVSGTDLSEIRNKALELAKNKGDYTLLLEPYEILESSKGFVWPKLVKDCYFANVRLWGEDAPSSQRILLIRNRLNWKWNGAVYEMLQPSRMKSYELIQGLTNICNAEIAFRYDTVTSLEKAIRKHPENERYVFLLAKEYFDLEQFDKAREYFERSLAKPGKDSQQTYLALEYLGKTYENLGESSLAIHYYTQAYTFLPSRSEALFRLATLYRQQGKYFLGFVIASHALSIPYPMNGQLVDLNVYDHSLLIEYANCALLLGKFREGFEACDRLLKNPNLPKEYREQVAHNWELARNKL